jgi:hypothetical protein
MSMFSRRDFLVHWELWRVFLMALPPPSHNVVTSQRPPHHTVPSCATLMMHAAATAAADDGAIRGRLCFAETSGSRSPPLLYAILLSYYLS